MENDSSSQNTRVERDCPLCGSSRRKEVLTKGLLSLARCCDCGMRFATPVAEHYLTGAFYDEIEAPYYISPDKISGDFAPNRFKRELRIFRRHSQGGDVLDAGCSTGAFLHRLDALFPKTYHVTGLEISGAAAAHARSLGIHVIDRPFLELPEETLFDAITFWAVLEHVPDPAAFVAKAGRLLKPGGVLFALVPNFRSLAARLLQERYRYIYEDHINYFDSATLRRLVEQAGMFRVVETGGSHFNPAVIIKDFQRPRDRVPDAERAALLTRTNRLKQSVAGRVAWPFYMGAERLLAWFGLADNIYLAAQKEA